MSRFEQRGEVDAVALSPLVLRQVRVDCLASLDVRRIGSA
jgi:hypothetical protein